MDKTIAKIEHNIPFPTNRVKGATVILRKLKIGDSFLFKIHPYFSYHSLAKHLGIKVTIRMTDGGTRVWRIK